MKKLISSLLAAVMVLSLSTTVFAATSVSDFTDEDYVYIQPKDYASLRDMSIGRKGSSWEDDAKVIFGETSGFDGIRNVSGSGNWLWDADVDSSVTSIKLPKSVVILGEQAFYSRHVITSVNLDELENLKHIGGFAFYGVSLVDVDLSNTKVISIDLMAFGIDDVHRLRGSKYVKNFKAPSTLKRIGRDAFYEQYGLDRITLNEGLEIIEDGAFKACGGFIIPSTVSKIGKDALNPNRTYWVYVGSYAEQYCKENKIPYIHTDGTKPYPGTETVTTAQTVLPAADFPVMENTKTFDSVTFSNYVSHEEQKGRDGIIITRVRITDKGSIRADRDNTEFIYWWVDNWYSTDNYGILTDRGAYTRGGVLVTLETRKILSYATTKANGAWGKGLTWQFMHKSQSPLDNAYSITVDNGGRRYYYIVDVVPGSQTTAPAATAAEAAANPTNSKVIVNGKQVSFDAYNINNNNYFKLRDIAQIIVGTDKQFNVTWDGTKNAINLISNQDYKTVGGELKSGDGKVKNAALSTSAIYKDGTQVNLTAYTINDNNYFKLRDLGQVFNFSVTWDSENNAIVIDTTKDYIEE